MGRINKGKKKLQYRFCLRQRGHVNARDLDMVVRLGKKIISRVGFSRLYNRHHDYKHELDLSKFRRFVGEDVTYTNAFLRHFRKYLSALR